MPRRLLSVLLPAAVFAAGCGGDGPGAGAARAVIAWHDFAPGCLRLTAKGDAGDPKVSDVALEDEARNGQRIVAVFRAEDWGPDVALTAQAFEGSCAAGTVVAESSQQAHITSGVVELAFELTATDADKDGFVDASGDHPGTDCLDTDAAVHPGVAEVCNMADDNCDGAIDEGVKLQLYWDGDHDGFGAGPVFEGCSASADWVADATDCDDERDDVHPGMPELCNGIDDDCSGAPDEGLILSTFYEDADGDGFGNPAKPVMACVQGPKMVTDNTDCDDDPLKGGATAHPGGTEVCDTFDNDCDGSADEGLLLSFFVDADGDGYGDDTQDPAMACTQPPGHAAAGGDCDDTNNATGKATHPGAAETCNMIDDDCDDQIDEGVKLTFYADADGDTFGDPLVTQQACSAPAGFVADATDCNDGSSAIRPGATETCNMVDDNCSGVADEGVTLTFYADTDGDTFGNPANPTQACTPPVGYVQDNTDCNDASGAIHPGATETCNYVDDNCNSMVDEGVSAAGFFDLDLDGSGGAAGQGCTALPGFVTTSGDCDDGNPFMASGPGATEVCDLLDNDCDGTADNGAGCGSSDWVKPGMNGGGNQDYRRLAIVSTGAFAVGVGGLRYFPASNANGSNFDSACGGSPAWHSAAADYFGGTAYFGNDQSRLGGQASSGGACAVQTTFQVGGANVDLRGMAYLYDLSGGPETIQGITAGGHIFRWDVTGTTVTEVASVPGTFYDFDGVFAGGAFAVGAGPGSTVKPFIIRSTSPTTWAADTIDPAVTLTTGDSLRAVSVAINLYAAAVGDNGLVLVRDPFPGSGPVQWKALPPPPGADDLQGVKCFGKNLIYVVGTGSGTGTVNGYGLWRWTGTTTGWTAINTVDFENGKTPRDIDGASPDDLWIAGLDGFVRHWTP